MLKLIGYWSDGPEYQIGPSGGYELVLESKNWIHPKLLIDETFEAESRPLLVTYLKSGVKGNYMLGYSFCRFPDGSPGEEMGDCEQTDGVWVWPEGLWVYVEKYKVRLPEEFIAHVKVNGFQIPAGIDEQIFDGNEYDVDAWKTWCERMRSGAAD